MTARYVGQKRMSFVTRNYTLDQKEGRKEVNRCGHTFEYLF